MTIKYKELFGLEAVSDEALERAAESSAEVIPMYWGTSRDTKFANDITLIRETFPYEWDSDGNAAHSLAIFQAGIPLRSRDVVDETADT